MAHSSDSWDGKAPMETTHRTDECEILRKVQALQAETAQVPAWMGSNSQGWKPARSQHFQAGAIQICRDHNITNMLIWYWFCDRAMELTAATVEEKTWEN